MSIPPGSTIGIVGGGQLGRMLAMAAAQLGYRCHIYAPDEAPPDPRAEEPTSSVRPAPVPRPLPVDPEPPTTPVRTPPDPEPPTRPVPARRP